LNFGSLSSGLSPGVDGAGRFFAAVAPVVILVGSCIAPGWGAAYGGSVTSLTFDVGCVSSEDVGALVLVGGLSSSTTGSSIVVVRARVVVVRLPLRTGLFLGGGGGRRVPTVAL
jgi:hypothetical protein